MTSYFVGFQTKGIMTLQKFLFQYYFFLCLLDFCSTHCGTDEVWFCLNFLFKHCALARQKTMKTYHSVMEEITQLYNHQGFKGCFLYSKKLYLKNRIALKLNLIN